MARIFTKDDYRAEDLLQAGIDHLGAVEVLLKENPSFFDSAGYLAQKDKGIKSSFLTKWNFSGVAFWLVRIG